MSQKHSQQTSQQTSQQVSEHTGRRNTGTPLRRHLGRRLLVGAVLFLALALGVGVFSVVRSVNPAPTEAGAALVKVERASGVDAGSDRVIWVLAVGSDARMGEDMLRTRGDALQLVGINTRTGAASVIGIPRDSWTSIPGHGSNRVNAALYFGGPQLLGRTVGDLIGVQPDYVFVTRFQGMRDMVDAIGGITVDNPRAFSDTNLWPQGFEAGRIKLNGHGATAFSRSRKGLLGGDFDRSANQQRVVRAIQQKVRSHHNDVGFMARGVVAVMRHLHTDLSAPELYRLAQVVAKVDPGKVRACVVQGGIGNIGGASVVLPDTAGARAMGADARRDGTLSRCR